MKLIRNKFNLTVTSHVNMLVLERENVNPIVTLQENMALLEKVSIQL